MANPEQTIYKTIHSIVVPKVNHFKGPTCEQFEPNFLKVFSFAENLRNVFINGTIVSDAGLVIACMLEEQEIFGLQRQLKRIPSNRSIQSLLIKNPNKLGELKSTVGVRNGLFVFEDIAFAVKIGSLGNYITRPVIPEYQELFVQKYTSLTNLLTMV